MKALMRWSATFSLVGGILLGSLLIGQETVLALTDEEVAERLRPVPVFTLTDGEGAPLVAAPRQGQEGNPVAGVFISRTDAETFLTNLRNSNPNLAADVQILPVSLAEVYELAQSAEEQENPLQFAFVPMQAQVNSALTILREDGETVEQFQGVPLFIARSSEDNGGYLTIQQGEQQVIPMFFTQEDLTTMMTRLQQNQPELAATMSTQVITLEGLIQTLEESSNEDLTQILLVPPRESIEYIRSLDPAIEGE